MTNQDNPAGSFGLARLVRLDLGADAQAQDIAYHVYYLSTLSPAQLQAYSRRLGL